MSTEPDSPAQPRRGLRFGLRTLLLLFLLAPVAGWYWWRTPFSEELTFEEMPQDTMPNASRDLVETVDGRTLMVAPFLIHAPRKNPTPNPPANPFGGTDPFAAGAPPAAANINQVIGYSRREVRTMRRTGLKSAIRHGPSTHFNLQGAKIVEENWREGILHGPYRHWDAQGTLRIEGEYQAGKQHGEWIRRQASGDLLFRRHYEEGAPTGVWEVHRRGAKSREEEYVGGVMRRSTTFVFNRRTKRVTRIRETLMDEEGKRQQVSSFDLNKDGKRVKRQLEFFVAGVREGKQTAWDADGNRRFEGGWKGGQPEGKWTWWDEESKVQRVCEFRDGDVPTINGKPAPDNGLRQAVSKGDPRARRIRDSLDEDTVLEMHDVPLSEVFSFLSDLHGVPFRVNHRAIPSEMPNGQHVVTASLRGLPLRVALAIILAEHDFAYVYRFEHLQITTLDDALQWKDESGLAELELPNKLRAALERDAALEFIDTPLSDVAKFLSNVSGARIECTSDAATIPITSSLRGLKLQSILGVMLDEYELRVELDDGALVIARRKRDEKSAN